MRQPWLPGSDAGRTPDDFSPASDVRRAGAVALTLALALLLLVMGRSEQILHLAFGLEPGAVADRFLATAEWWHAAMLRLGVVEAVEWLRAISRR